MAFSVLMSVYYNEKATYLDQALSSVLIDQSVKPDEVVIVKDGPLTADLEQILNKYLGNYGHILKIISLSTNQGLGRALSEGLDNCTHEIIARVDSDDINHPLRFEKQLNQFTIDEKLDLVGGNIAEFINNKEDIVSIRKVPSDLYKIRKMAKIRNPINHMTVMFKKRAVLEVGGYQHLSFLEDYYLWVRMLSKGCKLLNLDEILVYARIGDGMYRRRSNREYIRSWLDLQQKMRDYRMINCLQLTINMISIVFFIFTPAKSKKIIYKLFLRN